MFSIDKDMRLKRIIYFSLWVLLFIVISFVNFGLTESFAINESKPTYISPNVSFPFKNIRDENNKNTNVIAIVAPFRNKTHEITYQKLKSSGFYFIGMTSYLDFPGKIRNPYDPAYNKDLSEYQNKCDLWLSCLRNNNIFKKGTPIANISQSDFIDPQIIYPNPKLVNKWDFIYVCLEDEPQCKPGWNWINRNWHLALYCIEIMCLKYHLNGVIIGRKDCPIPKALIPKLTLLSRQPYWKFIQILNQSRFTFFPNIQDASPRCITEGFCLNKPTLLNKNIVGGYKYINNQTGEFFNGKDDFAPQLESLLKRLKRYTPRKYYSENYGPRHSGKKLNLFLKTYIDHFTPCQLAIPYCCD